ncbi:hypothetical protein QAD02_020210 [Eretmocerus hayati]|uniref:Uncharacterized protein n=1 Tax=Eretmocerus hayati TaxID=131215 RepID=A0ACC2PN10_9HYME|nr:hypothetical protein QAD02_020210 [Eretmocerus hayati]
MDQRLNKRPYSYYYIGRKLWYVPLYFSIYFIIYIAALVLKSIARHKINFPSSLAAAAGGNYAAARSESDPNVARSSSWKDHITTVLEAIEAYSSMQRASKLPRKSSR